MGRASAATGLHAVQQHEASRFSPMGDIRMKGECPHAVAARQGIWFRMSNRLRSDVAEGF